MPSLRTLKQSANASAFLRGHKLGRWTDYLNTNRGGDASYNECKVCGRVINLRTKPAPNETAISGDALAIDCTKE